MTDEILTRLKELVAIDSPTGFTKAAADYVFSALKEMGLSPVYTNKGGVFCTLTSGDSPLLISAHLDTLGGIVSKVKSNGRLKIAPLGGLGLPNIEAENCRIYTYDGKVYTGTFQFVNPSIHVNHDYRTTERTYDNMEVVLDEITASKEETVALGIENGCFVCFEPRLTITESGYIKSRFLDDKLSAAIVLAFAKQVTSGEVVPSRSIVLHFSVFEEVGHGGSASVPADTVETLCVDMGCVGDGLSCTEREVSICVKDARGPYHYEMTRTLVSLAKELNLRYATDVYPFYSSDADMALTAGHDIRHALIGPGVYASHGYERSHIDGALNTLALIGAYAKRPVNA